jgi:hypothetical protein
MGWGARHAGTDVARSAGADLTLREIQAELRSRCGIAVCLATIHVRLRRLGLRHKKRR